MTRAELTRFLLVVVDLCKKWGGGRDQAAFGVWGGPPATLARLSGPYDAP